MSRMWEDRPPRYSRAVLETLALIAYKQPVTRGDIEQVRGVAVNSNMVRALLERDWIRVVGYREVPGRPAMYGTTKTFLDYFNLKSLDELPTLPEIPGGQIVWGGVLFPLLWTGAGYGLMGVVNPLLQQEVDWPWFIASQVVYGLAMSLVVILSEKVQVPPAGGDDLSSAGPYPIASAGGQP